MAHSIGMGVKSKKDRWWEMTGRRGEKRRGSREPYHIVRESV